MNDFQKDYLMKRQDYGLLYPYVIEETVTDISYGIFAFSVSTIQGHTGCPPKHIYRLVTTN